jgi:hypothetical protein
MSSSEEPKKDDTQFILSIIGLSLSCMIILGYIVITNLCTYRKNVSIFKPTKNKYVDYLITLFIFPYVAILNSAEIVLKNLFLGKSIIQKFIIIIVFVIYLASIISLSILESD